MIFWIDIYIKYIVKSKLKEISEEVKLAEVAAKSREKIDKAADNADAAAKEVLIQLKKAEESVLVAINTSQSVKKLALDAKNSNKDTEKESPEVAATKAEAVAEK